MELFTAVKEVAHVRGVTFTNLAETWLDEGLRRSETTAGQTYLQPEVSAVIAKHFDRLEQGFVPLLKRAAIDAGTTKRLLMHYLIAAEIHSPAEVDSLEAQAFTASRKAIYSALEPVDKVFADLKAHEF